MLYKRKRMLVMAMAARVLVLVKSMETATLFCSCWRWFRVSYSTIDSTVLVD